MKPTTKHILVALGIAAGVFIVYEMYKVISAGVTAVSDIFMAPWNALKTVWSAASGAVAGAVSPITSTVANVSAGNAAAATIAALNNQYAPGGSIYNQIQASRGTAAADQAWQTVQNNQAVQTSQTVTWDPLTWF